MANLTNISLIGMPWAGKSTVGVMLAKALSFSFLDTDVLIQVAEERSQHEIIQTEGIERYARIEQRHLVAMDRRKHVIALGSTVVLGPAAIQRVRGLGPLVHLDVPLDILVDRMAKANGNGRILPPGHTLSGIYQQWQPLYQQFANVTIDCADRSQEQLVEEIVARVAVCQVA